MVRIKPAIRLSEWERYVLLSLAHQDSGFVMPFPTERALLRKGLIEKKGTHTWRLTDSGVVRLARINR